MESIRVLKSSQICKNIGIISGIETVSKHLQKVIKNKWSTLL